MAYATPDILFFIAGSAGLLCGVFLVLGHMQRQARLMRRFKGIHGSVEIDVEEDGLIVIRPLWGSFPLALHNAHAHWPVLKTQDDRMDRKLVIQMPNFQQLSLLNGVARRCLLDLDHVTADPHAIRTDAHDGKLVTALIELANRLLETDPLTATIDNLDDRETAVRRTSLLTLEAREQLPPLVRPKLEHIHEHDPDRANRVLAGKILGIATPTRRGQRTYLEGSTHPVT